MVRLENETKIMTSSLPFRKLEIGAGGSHREGFVHTDIVNNLEGHLEYLFDATKTFPFEDGVFTEIFMEGVFEHFTCKEGLHILDECYRVLAFEGMLEFTTPDLVAVCKIVVDGILPFNDSLKRPPIEYALSCLYGGQDDYYHLHKWGWEESRLRKVLEEKKFKIKTLDMEAYEPGTHLHIKAIK